ncbi:MAG TPA: GGDEF domain-containing phosphodiesterase, partial [Candidatus Dormibacteraeota bacterium]|nr:GGDEF domain-containing phosphodiesterase [Candidatus Dormibacteraeota bacterium]
TYLQRPDQSSVPVLIHAVPVLGVSPEGGDVVVMLREIGGLAYHDPLTRLPNHTLFADRLERAIERSVAGGHLTAVLVVKLDRLHVVTETLGQAATDRVMAEAADRLLKVLGSKTTRSTFESSSGGYLALDALGVALGGVVNDVDAVRTGQAILDLLSGPFQVADIQVPMTASIGIAIAAGAETAADLLRTAGAAAAAVESAGGAGIELFDPSRRVHTAERLRQEVDLHRAVDGGQFYLCYQPEIALVGGRPTGAEALVRWQHPERGLINPADFIPLAEETGLIVPIGRWVISEACRQAAAWQRELPGGEQFTVAVNLSARQLTDGALLEHLRLTLDETGIAPQSLLLEITESAVMHTPDQAAQTLRELRALGVRLGIDDFGTGYSSLLYLRSFPVDLLKIDRVFVDGMCRGADDAAIVKGTIQLAHAMDLRVVAEGVETRSQLAELRTLGCDLGQGYYWSRPVEPAKFERWWRTAIATADPDHVNPNPAR